MPGQIKVVEPHPTVRKYAHTGRGGAGNTVKAEKTSNGRTAQGPASLLETGLPASAKFSSGRGGAGNIHKNSERALFSFDEELERQITREKMIKEGGVYHVGRGGAGNWTATSTSSSSRKDSSSSSDSARSGFFGRLSHTFERH